jgi:hypothetical protein
MAIEDYIGPFVEGFASVAGPMWEQERRLLATAEARRQEVKNYKLDAIDQLLTTARGLQSIDDKQAEQLTNSLLGIKQNDLDDLNYLNAQGGNAITFSKIEPDKPTRGINIGGGFTAIVANTSPVKPASLADRKFNALLEFQALNSNPKNLASWAQANPQKMELAKSQYFGAGNRLFIKRGILTTNGLLNKEQFGDDEKDAVYTITDAGAQILVSEYGGQYSEAIDANTKKINIDKIKKIPNHIIDLYNSQRLNELSLGLIRGYQAGSLQAKQLVENATEEAEDTGEKINTAYSQWGSSSNVNVPVPAGKIPSVLVNIMKEEFSAAQLQAKDIKQQGRPSKYVTNNTTTSQVINNIADTIIAQSNDAFADYKLYIIEMLEMSFQELD